jgi:hypothetical protein
MRTFYVTVTYENGATMRVEFQARSVQMARELCALNHEVHYSQTKAEEV